MSNFVSGVGGGPLDAAEGGKSFRFSSATSGVIEADWLLEEPARAYVDSLFDQRNRIHFGLLEQPTVKNVAQPEEFEFKVFFAGKSNAGKTSTICKLADMPVPPTHQETIGMHTQTVHWPVKMKRGMRNGQTGMIKFRLWDTGERVLTKYDHILEACLHQAHAIVFVFSFTDRASFDMLLPLMTKLAGGSGAASGYLVKAVVGTKFDQFMKSQVTERELEEFSAHWKVPVFRTSNIGSGADLTLGVTSAARNPAAAVSAAKSVASNTPNVENMVTSQGAANIPEVPLRQHKLEKLSEVSSLLNGLADLLLEANLSKSR